MQSPFDQTSIAAGYAKFRPPMHRQMIQCVREDMNLPMPFPFRRALDLGCGSGLSTEALSSLANDRIGLEPVEEMLRWSGTVAPGAHFLAGRAEAIPLRSQSVDLITAAGSLNYADLFKAVKEAARVLEPNGLLVVYDFQPGRSFRDSPDLDQWFAEFVSRYPWPPDEAQEVSPEILQQVADDFHMERHNNVRIGIPLALEFYIEYMLTETNVASAMRNGTPAPEIRSWCEETLRPVWDGKNREILFSGYYACLRVN
jgi:ubiquinone/menaquinone biosynthesis C-methylase UbiE